MIIAGFAMTFLQIQAQVPDFEWAVKCGGDTTIYPSSMAIDPDGNQVYTGYFIGTVDFNPDPGVTYNITSNGSGDIFILKLGPAGNFLWAAGMGDVDTDCGNSIATDDYGNIYTTGYFVYSMDADPGNGEVWLTQTKPAAYVLKIAPDGNLTWARQMGFPGDWGLAYGQAITLDNDLNVISAGRFVGRVDFDPGAGTFNMSLSGGSYDGYIQKLNNNGDFIWAKQLAGNSQEFYKDLTTDPNGNIYAAGTYGGTADFNPDKKQKYNITAYGINDIFYQKLTSNGTFGWAKHLGGTGNEYCYVIHYDASNGGSLYIAGLLADEGDYDPGNGTLILTPFGGYDVYLEKLDLNGNLVWVKQMGGSSSESSSGIETDPDGNVYLSGYFNGTADFNPDVNNSFYMTSEGVGDIFVMKTDPSGNFIWSERLGGNGNDAAHALALDNYGHLLVGASFEETADFDPDGDEVYLLTPDEGSVRTMAAIKLNLSGGDICPIPVNLQVAGITTSSADLSWDLVQDAGGYFVRYRTLGTTEWIALGGPVTVTTIQLTGLAEATYFEFQVKTDCQSNFSYSGEFSTLGTGCLDLFEPNNSMAEAVQIQAATDYNGLINVLNEQDWFKINTTNSAKNLMVTLTDLPADYNIRLVKGDGTVLGYSANAGTENEMIIYNCKQAGLYYIHIYGYDGAFNPMDCYTLRVEVSGTQYSKSYADGNEVVNSENQLIVYPNPSNSEFHFIAKTESKEPVMVQVFDISGRLVQEMQSIPPNELITAGADLDYGIYIAVMMQGTVKKFVKIAKVE